MLSEFRSWDYVQVDPALQQTDLHAAGVAIKPLRGAQVGALGWGLQTCSCRGGWLLLTAI